MSNEQARLIATAKGFYHKQGTLAFEKSAQDDACRTLNSYGLLSVQAIGAIVGVSSYRVRKALEFEKAPTARGQLNPHHLLDLGYLLAYGIQAQDGAWLRNIVNGGTSVATIHTLTNIPTSALYRRLND